MTIRGDSAHARAQQVEGKPGAQCSVSGDILNVSVDTVQDEQHRPNDCTTNSGTRVGIEPLKHQRGFLAKRVVAIEAASGSLYPEQFLSSAPMLS